MARKKSLLRKIEKSLRRKAKIRTEALLPRQKKIIQKVPIQKTSQGFFHFD